MNKSKNTINKNKISKKTEKKTISKKTLNKISKNNKYIKGGVYNYKVFMDMPREVRMMIVEYPYNNTSLINKYHQQKGVLEYYYRERDKLMNIFNNSILSVQSYFDYHRQSRELNKINNKILELENKLIETQMHLNLLRDFRN